MKVCLLVAVAVFAGCGRTPAPACPTPVVAAPAAEASEAPEPDEIDAPAGAMSPDGLYACSRPRGDLEVTMREDFSAKDLVVAYLGITCANVLLPTELAERRHKGGFHGRLKPVEIEPRFRALFEAMGLALVRERGMAIVVDQAWLARRPGLLLLERADTAVLLSSSPSIPPPLDTPPPPPTLEGITRIGDTHHVVTRATVNDHVAAGGKPARVVPSVKNGQPDGAKLYAIRPSSLYAGLGLRNGDTVHAVNGAPVTDVAALALDRLLAPSRVELAITRRGKPETLVIEVRD